jgi:hypothetical protein
MFLKEILAPVCFVALISAPAFAQQAPPDPGNNEDNEDEFAGYIGVNVVQDGLGGMQITGFLPDTPAATLHEAGEIRKGDSIVKLAGKQTRTLSQLKKARNDIPLDKEGKMVIKSRQGGYYFVWVSRKHPEGGNAAFAAAAPDKMTFGGKGEGKDHGDLRPKGGSNQKPNNNNESNEDDGDGPDIR